MKLSGEKRLVVVGGGVAGLAAAWSGSLAGFSVDCIESRRFGNDSASSTGQGKIFRFSYDDPFYVGLLLETALRWRDLERMVGYQLIQPCEHLGFGGEWSDSIKAVQASMHDFNRDFRLVKIGQDTKDFSIRLTDSEVGIIEEGAGIIYPDAAMAALGRAARQSGVQFHQETSVRAIESRAEGLAVETDKGVFSTDRVIVAAGPWIRDLLPEVRARLTITRQYQTIFSTDHIIGNGKLSSWAHIAPDDHYGVTNLPNGNHIIGTHSLGEVVHPNDPVDPRMANESQRIQLEFLRRRLYGDIAIKPLATKACHYTNTPGGGFLVAASSTLPGVVVLSACSGHGFKFGITTGYYAAKLAAGETIPEPARFSI